jgi:hypothetical protein
VQRLGHLLAASGYFADAREMAQAAVKVMAGEELGIPPIAAMMGINIIKGKVALGANLIASRIRAHGYDYRFKQFDSTGCVIEFLSRIEDGKRRVMGESSFTDADAKAAGISSDMYKKYPRNMFFARAMSNGARWHVPEVFAGSPVYCPEELGATVDEQGEVVQPAQTRAEATNAAESVAERKIADMKAGASYEQASASEQQRQTNGAPKPELSFADRLKHFSGQRQRIGDQAYYAVLGANGFEHANQIKSLNDQRRIYRELSERADYTPETAEVGDAFEEPATQEVG